MTMPAPTPNMPTATSLTIPVNPDHGLKLPETLENHCGNHDNAAADAKQAASDSADNPDESRCRTEISGTLGKPFTDHPRMLFAESLPANQIHAPTKVEH